MSTRSQAELEIQYHQRTAQVQAGTLSPQQAFGNIDEWVINLGKRKALLHPGFKQWMWYDHLHDEWVSAGCGVGEAILLLLGDVAGIKKLPQPGNPAGWCIYRQGQEAFGPMPVAEMLTKLKSQPTQPKTILWSPLATDWLTVAYPPGGEISFHDDSGNRITIPTKDGLLPPVATRLVPPVSTAPARKPVAPPASIPQKKSNKKFIIPIVIIVILLCFCLPALVGIVYFVAKNAGVLPAWLGGIPWLPPLIF